MVQGSVHGQGLHLWHEQRVAGKSGVPSDKEHALKSIGRTVAWVTGVSVVGNVVLFAAKYAVGLLTHSVALQADAWHTLSDSLTSIIVMVAYRMGRKPPDREHPFGHGRYELVATLLVGMFLLLIGVMFAYQGYEQLASHRQVDYGLWAIVVTVLSIVVKEAMAQYAFWGARRTKNSALHADGWHHRSDALSSVIVLAGILLGSRFWWIDGVLAILVAVFIIYVAVKTMHEASSRIAGERPSAAVVKQILAVLESACPGCSLHVHQLRYHNYIYHQEVTLHIKLPAEMTIAQAYDLTSHLEEQLAVQMGLEATIHVEPIRELVCVYPAVSKAEVK